VLAQGANRGASRSPLEFGDWSRVSVRTLGRRDRSDGNQAHKPHAGSGAHVGRPGQYRGMRCVRYSHVDANAHANPGVRGRPEATSADTSDSPEAVSDGRCRHVAALGDTWLRETLNPLVNTSDTQRTTMHIGGLRRSNGLLTLTDTQHRGVRCRVGVFADLVDARQRISFENSPRHSCRLIVPRLYRERHLLSVSEGANLVAKDDASFDVLAGEAHGGVCEGPRELDSPFSSGSQTRPSNQSRIVSGNRPR
jgi:hypothetical protein